jgi:hypothetical protein
MQQLPDGLWEHEPIPEFDKMIKHAKMLKILLIFRPELKTGIGVALLYITFTSLMSFTIGELTL